MRTKEEINHGFRKLIHCSMQVVEEKAEAVGLDKETAMRISAPFAGGMLQGHTCGAVSGALMIIGAKYGHHQEGDEAGNAAMSAKTVKFLEAFTARNGSTQCKDILGYDFSNPEEVAKAYESGVIFETCPQMVQDALAILEELL